MTNPAKKVVVVLGASGRQGGSTARHLLSTSDFHVRAITRNTANPKLAELAALGASIVRASFDELDSLVPAFSSAYAIFANTNFANTRSVVAERQQGVNIAQTAAGVRSLEHFLWSGALDVESLSEGKYRDVVHMKGKAEVAKYIEEQLPQLAAKMTEVFVPPYFENWELMPGLYGPIANDDNLKLSLPVSSKTHWPSISIHDIGKVMCAILRNPEATRGRSVNGASETLAYGQMLEQWGRGEQAQSPGQDHSLTLHEEHETPVEYREITPEDFESRNIGEYAKLFGGEGPAAIFVRAASEQMQFMEDVTRGQISLHNVLQVQDVALAGLSSLSWKQFAAGVGAN